MAQLNPNISRRGFMRLALAGAGAAAFAWAFAQDPEAAYAAEEASAAAPYANTVKVAILSDIHYMSHTLFAENDAFHSAENSDRKLFRQSADILDKALQDVRAYKPNAIFVSGDLTKDGEQVCHNEVRTKLLQAADDSAEGCVVRIINGNHDINNNVDGRNFKEIAANGEAAPAGTVKPSEFRSDTYYGKCGYNDADELYVNSSYYPQPEPGHDATAGAASYVTHFDGTDGTKVTMICVDSCRYSYDTTDTGTDEHETHGRITGVPKDADGNAVFDPSQLGTTGLLPWILKKAQDAKNNGDVVFAMQHHGIVAHFGQEPTIFADYLVEDYDVVARYYAWAGISCVLTGHMHANDVAVHQFPEFRDTSNHPTAVPAIYDIETCATITYPSDIRYLTLNFGKDADGATGATLAFASHKLGAVTYTLKNEDGSLANWDDAGTPAQAEIADITEFGHERLISKALLTNVVGVYGAMALKYIEATDGPHFIESLKVPGGGIKALLASMLSSTLAPDATEELTADQLNGAVFKFLAKYLTDAGYTSVDAGLKIAVPNKDLALGMTYQTVLGKAISIWYNTANSLITINNTDNASTAAITLATTPEQDARAAQIVYDTVAENGGVMPAAVVNLNATISATGDVSLDTFLNAVFADLDAIITNNGVEGAKLLDAVQRILVDACDAPIPANPSENLLGIINYAYADHLKGDEKRDAWVQTALDAMNTNTGVDADGNKVENDGSLISFIRKAVDGNADDAGQAKAADLMLILAAIHTDATKLASIDAGAVFTSIIKKLLSSNYGTADKLVSALAGSDSTPGMAIPDIPALRTFVMPILYTLTEDDNTAKPGDDAESGTEPDASKVDPSAGLENQGDHHFGFTVGTGALTGEVVISGDSVSENAAKLQLGKTLQLTATYQSNAPQTYAAYDGKWSSDNESVATVDAQSGLVTAVTLGTANISAMVNGTTASVAVTVVAAEVAGADILNVDFRRRSAQDWTGKHAPDRSRYRGGTRMDKTLRQPVAMMDGKGGLGYKLTEDDYSAMQNGFTMELLFKVPSTKADGKNQRGLFDNVQNDGMGLYLDKDDGAKLTFEVKQGASSSKTVSVSGVQANTWYHVVAVNDNAGTVSGEARMTLYVNGTQSINSPDAQAVGSQEKSNTIYIGAGESRNNGGPEYPAARNTAIAFARIYGKALSADDAAQLYAKSGLAK
ncbi:LamG-like jellyroll fold domain-containing protein [uncultured Parolsenella sp.]|uniref:LamG-like jellyroll fold domain-containing protein n=1 Tax=uncultured Parolsenella sp. TaxID=2083008 RepID=UPI0025D040B5|nr:LamG-like jellyroll fold domain-containing protein [uncultured Parolsenella sp.]